MRTFLLHIFPWYRLTWITVLDMTDSISAPNDDPLNSMVPFARVNSNDSMDSSSKVRAKRPSSSNSAQAPSPSMAKSKEKKSATDDLGIMSFRKAKYESVEMQRLLSLGIPDVNISTTLDDLTYKPSLVFPDWVRNKKRMRMIWCRCKPYVLSFYIWILNAGVAQPKLETCFAD